MTRAPGAMLGRTYRVVRSIGGGGMGDVYEVTHERLAGRYAAKVLNGDFGSHPDAFTRFRREAMVTSGLRHPGIVQVIDFDRDDEGHPFMVMELLEGQELATIIERSAPLGLSRTVGIVEQIGSALAAAHAQGIVHRDLKPQNVFVSTLDRGREVVKILDFGISKAQVETRRLTRTAAVIGTPQYMAPEQAMGRGAEVDARADQFALAAITYEMLSGQPAFSGDSVVALIYQVLQVDPPPLATVMPHLPPDVEAVIRRGLAKQPGARYPDVDEFVAALSAGAGATAGSKAPLRPGGGGSVGPTSEPPAASAAPIGRTQKFPTTLSGSAAQAHGPRRRAPGGAAILLVVALAISAASAAIWVRRARHAVDANAPAGAAGQPPAAAVAPAPAQLTPPPASSTGAAAAAPAEPARGAPPSLGAAAIPAPATASDAPVGDPTPSTAEPTKRDQLRKRRPARSKSARTEQERHPRDELVDDL